MLHALCRLCLVRTEPPDCQIRAWQLSRVCSMPVPDYAHDSMDWQAKVLENEQLSQAML